MGLSALRTFITLLAILQVCEERRFKIEKTYILSYRQGVSLYLHREDIEIFYFQEAFDSKGMSSAYFDTDQGEHVL